jgi:probable H4MPT-linked C1 transfer pathway protein
MTQPIAKGGTWLALDIGGANLKAADGLGYAASRPFPLWEHPERLTDELRHLLSSAPTTSRLAITMTGEIADCFEIKADGVRHILDAVEQAAAGREIAVYLVTGELVTPRVARQEPALAASSNWHALATFACRHASAAFPPQLPPPGAKPGLGLLLDIGSTTADIIAIGPTGPLSRSRSDIDRLVCGELVYTGVRRSPICGVVSHLPWRGTRCPVAQELFATTADAYVLLGELPEDASASGTADGRPLTRAAAHARMARMLCLDRDSFTDSDATLAATAVRGAQLGNLRAALDRVLSAMPAAPRTFILSGEGEFLTQRLLTDLAAGSRIVSLAAHLGQDASRAAPAHALAVLARERGNRQ